MPPPRLRAALICAVVVFAYGTVVHVAHLVTAGPNPYRWAPLWLAAYFVSLTVLDPLAALLLTLRRAAGLYLGVAVLLTDAAANAYATYVLDHGPPAARIGQAAITVLAVVFLAAAPVLRPWLRPDPPVPHRLG